MSDETTPDLTTTTSRPWPENAWPTAAELADWLSRCTSDERLSYADHSLATAQRAARCVDQQHDTHLARAESAEAALAGLREGIGALADAHEAVMDARLPMTDREERESGRKMVRRLRALLAPTPDREEARDDVCPGDCDKPLSQHPPGPPCPPPPPPGRPHG